MSVASAKAKLSQCIRNVEGGDIVIITRHGKPVAALVAPGDIERLERLRQAGPEKGLASLAGGWQGSQELANLLETSRRDDGRDTRLLD